MSDFEGRRTGLRSNRPVRRGVPLPMVLLAMGAAGAGGFLIGGRVAGPSEQDVHRSIGEAYAAMMMPSELGQWIVDRRAIIAAMRKERDALSEQHRGNSPSEEALHGAAAALDEAARAVDTVSRSTPRDDLGPRPPLVNAVNHSLERARAYMDRAGE